jgi:type V secretory pathway adhesin AidA
MEVLNKGPNPIYVLIQSADPGAGTAATTGRPVLENGGEWMIRLATSDNVWARSSVLQVAGAGTQVYEATA